MVSAFAFWDSLRNLPLIASGNKKKRNEGFFASASALLEIQTLKKEGYLEDRNVHINEVITVENIKDACAG